MERRTGAVLLHEMIRRIAAVEMGGKVLGTHRWQGFLEGIVQMHGHVEQLILAARTDGRTGALRRRRFGAENKGGY